MIRSRFVYRLFCFLTAFAVIGTPAHSSAAVKSSTSKKTVTTTAKKPAVRKTTSATVKRSATGTRRVRAARVRAAQQAAALRDALEPRFKFDETGNVVPDIRAEAAIIYNPETGKVLWEKKLEANPEGLPSVYEFGGRQYIVFCTRVGRVFDNIGAESIAWEQGKPEAAGYYVFALPKK